jgi:hypothetical protein
MSGKTCRVTLALEIEVIAMQVAYLNDRRCDIFTS